MKLGAALLGRSLAAESCSARCDGGSTAENALCNAEPCSVYTDGSNIFGEGGTFDSLDSWVCTANCVMELSQPGYYSDNAVLVSGRGVQGAAVAMDFDGDNLSNQDYKGRVFFKPAAGNAPGTVKMMVRNQKKVDNSNRWTQLSSAIDVPAGTADSVWIPVDFTWNPRDSANSSPTNYRYQLYLLYVGENGEFGDYYQDESFVVPADGLISYTSLVTDGDFESGTSLWYTSGGAVNTYMKEDNGNTYLLNSGRTGTWQSPIHELEITPELLSKDIEATWRVKSTTTEQVTLSGNIKVTLSDGTSESFVMPGCSVPGGDWMKASGMVNIAREIADTSLVTKVEFQVQGPASGVDIMIDDVDVHFYSDDKAWEVAADKRINQYRKANVQMDVNVPNAAKVKVKMTKNGFMFGGMCDKLMPDVLDNFEDDFFELFNGGVLRNEMKWYHNEPQMDVYQYDTGDYMIDLFEQKNATLRGHAVFWSVDKHVHGWVQDITDMALLEERMMMRTEDVISRYAGRIPNWDIFNEVAHGDYFRRNLPDGDAIWAKVMDRMLEIDPNVELVFNDYQLNTGDFSQCFLDVTSSIHSYLSHYGIQSHTKNPRPLAIDQRMNVMAGENLENRLLITEFDNEEVDVDRRAAELGDFMKMAYSHPNVDAIILWSWLREIQKPDWHRAMFESNVEGMPIQNPIIPKPDVCDEFNVLCNYPLNPNAAGYRWLELVKNEWNTTSGHANTPDLTPDLLAGDGVDLFRGTYDVDVYDSSDNLLTTQTIHVTDHDACKSLDYINFENMAEIDALAPMLVMMGTTTTPVIEEMAGWVKNSVRITGRTAPWNNMALDATLLPTGTDIYFGGAFKIVDELNAPISAFITVKRKKPDNTWAYDQIDRIEIPAEEVNDWHMIGNAHKIKDGDDKIYLVVKDYLGDILADSWYAGSLDEYNACHKNHFTIEDNGSPPYPCADVTCGEDQTCVDGNCECNSGLVWDEDTQTCIADPTYSFTTSFGTTFKGEATDVGTVHFKGIRYAESPTGDRRWKGPLATTTYPAEYDATQYAPKCMTRGWNANSPTAAETDEDCLFVNVHTKAEYIESGEKKPIMAYIHGGAYNFGDGRVEFNNLVLEQDVIYVSIQYRLGPYGFLYHEDADTPYKTNWGLLDQNVALQWIQQFAGEFGGDVNQVTLSGCSAGSAMTWWHLTVPESWPLFHRAITNGIGAYASFGNNSDIDISKGYVDYTMTQVGCEDIDCLRSKTPSELNSHFTDAITQVFNPTKMFLTPGFAPVVDGLLKTKSTLESLLAGEIRPNTPISWNYARDDAWGMVDGAFNDATDRLDVFAGREAEITAAQSDSGFHVPSDYSDQILKAIYGENHFANHLQSTFGCSDVNGAAQDCQDALSRFGVAQTWTCNTQYGFTGDALTNPDIGPIYPMELSYKTCEANDQNEQTRTCHCADNQMIMGNQIIGPWLPEDEQFFKLGMRNYWGEFIRSGTFPSDAFGTMKPITELNGDLNLIDINGIRQEPAYAAECAALNGLADEIGYLELYNNGYMHTDEPENPNEFSFTTSDGATTFTGEKTEFDNVHFKGIEFATAERWAPPVMTTSYPASVDATIYGASCMTASWTSSPDYSEDCLFINVHTKSEYIENGEKKPILIFIHGGGLQGGNGQEEFDRLVENEGVVMFSIQYRLGPYGFMYNHDSNEEHKGNWGFLDQQMALQWVQEFGGEFGGDINQVTIGGCSAGGQSIWWHLTMPSSWSFFHRAISTGIGVSGSNNATASLEVNRMYNNYVGEQIGCEDIACLRTKTPEELNPLFREAPTMFYLPGQFHDAFYGPIVDGVLKSKTNLEALYAGEIRPNTPISWNYNRDDVWNLLDGEFAKMVVRLDELADKLDDLAALQTSSGFEIPSDYTDQMLRYSYGDEFYSTYIEPVFSCPSGPNGEIVDCKPAMNQFINAQKWSCNTQYGLSGAPLTDLNIGPIYPMELQDENCVADENGDDSRVCHCHDKGLVFGTKSIYEGLSQKERDYRIASREYWGQFIREGTFPNGNLGEMKNIKQLNGMLNLLDEDGIVHGYAYVQECNALNALGDEIGHFALYQSGYYHTYDQGKL